MESDPIMEKEKSENSPSHGGSEIMLASSWPTTTSSLNTPCGLSEESVSFAALKSINGVVAQPSAQSCSRLSNGIAPWSHYGSYNNQNGNHHPHQTHGVRLNQNRNLHRNFNGRGGALTQPPISIPLIYTPYMQVYQPLFFGFVSPPMCYFPRVSFVEPRQEVSLEAKIQRQVHYYFSEDNLVTDEFLRKRMNDEGFVHIQFIAGFNKLKALTNDIQLISDALQGSNVVEVKGYEIRSRHMWKRFLMPHHLRIPFNPSLQYIKID